MNNKVLIAVIAIIIICAGAFALTNSGNTGSASIDANALEERGNLVVDSESLDENKGLYHTDSADTNAVLVKKWRCLKIGRFHH